MILHFSPSSETLCLLQFYALRPASSEHFGAATVNSLGLNIKIIIISKTSYTT